MSKDCYCNKTKANADNYNSIPPRAPDKTNTHIPGRMSLQLTYPNTKVTLPNPLTPKETIAPPGPSRSRLPDIVYFPPRGMNINRKELQCPPPSDVSCNISNNIIEVYKDPYSKCEVNSTRYDPVIRSVNNVQGKNIDLCGNITLGQTFPNVYYSNSYKGYLNYKKCKFPTKFNVNNNSNCDVSNNNNDPSYCGNLVKYNRGTYPNPSFLTTSAVSSAARINKLRYNTISCTKNAYPNDASNPVERCGLYIGGNASYQNIQKKPVICNTVADLARIRGRNINYDSCKQFNTLQPNFIDTDLIIIIDGTNDYAYWKNILDAYKDSKISIQSLTITNTATIVGSQLEDLTKNILYIKSTFTVLSNNIIDYVEIPCLVEIVGSTTISSNNNLLRITFPVLYDIADITISSNTSLNTIQVPELNSIDGDTTIDSNTNLPSINLPKLTLANGAFTIGSETILTQINAAQLRSVTGVLTITMNNALVTTNFNLLEIVGSHFIDQNIALATIDYPSLKINNGSLTITNNTALTTISFASLETITDNFTLSNNNSLVTPGLFNVLTTIGDTFTISNNNNLITATFNALTTIGTFRVHNNVLLDNLNATFFPSVTTMPNLDVSGNPSLQQIKFDKVEYMTSIVIEYNSALSANDSLSFSNLLDVSGLLTISNNSSYTFADGLLVFPFFGLPITVEDGILIINNFDNNANRQIRRKKNLVIFGGFKIPGAPFSSSGPSSYTDDCDHIYESSDGGLTWTKSTKKIPNGGRFGHSVVSLSRNPDDPNLFLIIGGVNRFLEPQREVLIYNGSFITPFTIQDLPNDRFGCKALMNDIANVFVIGGGTPSQWRPISSNNNYLLGIISMNRDIQKLTGNTLTGYSWSTAVTINNAVLPTDMEQFDAITNLFNKRFIIILGGKLINLGSTYSRSWNFDTVSNTIVISGDNSAPSGTLGWYNNFAGRYGHHTISNYSGSPWFLSHIYLSIIGGLVSINFFYPGGTADPQWTKNSAFLYLLNSFKTTGVFYELGNYADWYMFSCVIYRDLNTAITIGGVSTREEAPGKWFKTVDPNVDPDLLLRDSVVEYYTPTLRYNENIYNTGLPKGLVFSSGGNLYIQN